MVPSSVELLIQQKLSTHSGSPAHQLVFQSIGGGSINESFRISWGTNGAFCKINSAHKFPQLFEKEAAGLRLLEATGVIGVPAVIDQFETGDRQVLLLEWIGEGSRTPSFWKKFGEQLSRLHCIKGKAFGLEMHNYMGSVEQCNEFRSNWIEFFREQRLRPLVEKCAAQHLLSAAHQKKFESVYQVLPRVFDAAQEPVLVHGDLWSGNFMCDDAASPVLIDPAVYYGHPSVDLGMTTLFGGFSSAFYEAYHYHRPFPPDYKDQWKVCNLYPLLIHLLLFGRSYLSQIDHTLHSF